MKKTLHIISLVSIVLFGVLWFLSRFNFLISFNSTDIQNVLVMIYLITSLKYFQIEVREKNAEIQELKIKLKNIKRDV